MLQQVISVALLTAMAAAPRVSSQGIARNACLSCTTTSSAPAQKVLVATPYPSSSADSTAAVLLGSGIRNKIFSALNGGEWRIITRAEMNSNLVNSGYPPDALLPWEQAHALAVVFGARVLVATNATKTADGHYNVAARVVGIADDAGQVVRASQASGQAVADFGSKVADQLIPIFKAYQDARACNDQQTTNRQKAIDAANKALKAVPNYGFAEYCLGQIEQQKDSTSDAALMHFKNAAIGDPLSLRAVNMLAIIHDRRHDSSAVVADFQQMLTIAPTNRPLADAAYRQFQAYHRPDAAQQVIKEQMELDPTNPDWPDLKGNSCMVAAANDTVPASAKGKYMCADSAFKLEYQLEPTRADSTFFEKVLFVAQNSADSSLWVHRYVARYPSNVTPLERLAQLYINTNQVDSAVAVVNMLTKLDSTEIKPVLVVTQSLMSGHHEDAALRFLPYVKKNGDETAKNQFAGILINALNPLAQATPRNDSLLIMLGQAVVDLAPTAPGYVAYGDYFLSLGLLDNLTAISTATRNLKTCEALKAEDTLLTRLAAALTGASTSTTEAIATYGKTTLDKLTPEQAYVTGSMKEKHCE